MFDSQCYELSKSFLTDNGITDEGEISTPAQHIQNEIEDWIEAIKPPKETKEG